MYRPGRQSKKRVYTGKCLALQICLPGQEATLKVDLAAVRWAKGQEFGLEFITMEAGEWKRIRQFVKTLEPSRVNSEIM